MSDGALRVVQIGCGGYGDFYLSRLLDNGFEGLELVACADPFIGRCSRLGQLKSRNIPVFLSLEQMPSTIAADLAIIASPIQHHTTQTRAALERGMHVLCEKPLCATVQDGLALREIQRDAGRIVAIGYQWSFSKAVLGLKADVLAGAFGALRRGKSLVLWPRPRSYYARAGWAGRKMDCSGAWVLDSPVNNATSHYLHNMLFVAGSSLDRCAEPLSVTAELYRANEIENYDTGVLRCALKTGAELLFVTSHATGSSTGPAFELEFELAQVSCSQGGSEIIAELSDGSVRRYGSPDADPYRKVALVAEAIRGNTAPVCSIDTALAHIVCMNGAQESSAIAEFPQDMVCVANTGGEQRVWVEGLHENLERCYDEWRLPSELGYRWAVPGTAVNLASYTRFPSR
jgi:predicted dehydrogenase